MTVRRRWSAGERGREVSGLKRVPYGILQSGVRERLLIELTRSKTCRATNSILISKGVDCDCDWSATIKIRLRADNLIEPNFYQTLFIKRCAYARPLDSADYAPKPAPGFHIISSLPTNVFPFKSPL